MKLAVADFVPMAEAVVDYSPDPILRCRNHRMKEVLQKSKSAP